MRRIFILSPANTGGERARLLYNPGAKFSLACRLRGGTGVPLGEVFSFLSGLYFRGKLTYAKTFARPPRGIPGILVITSNRGLLPAGVPVSIEDLRSFSEVPIDPRDARYLKPLERDAELLAEATGTKCHVVFLGSIGTKKYADVLVRYFEERLWFPADFVGRGDMSRGGLLLRAAADGHELEYAQIAGAVRHGKRPGKLTPRRWGLRVLSGQTDLPTNTQKINSRRIG